MSEETPKTIPIDVQEIRPEDEGRVHDPQVAEVMAHAAAPHMDRSLVAEVGPMDFDGQFDKLMHEDKASEEANKAAADAGYTNEDVGHSSNIEDDHEIALSSEVPMPLKREVEDGTIKRIVGVNAKNEYVGRRNLIEKDYKKAERVHELRKKTEAIDIDRIEKLVGPISSLEDYSAQLAETKAPLELKVLNSTFGRDVPTEEDIKRYETLLMRSVPFRFTAELRYLNELLDRDSEASTIEKNMTGLLDAREHESSR